MVLKAALTSISSDLLSKSMNLGWLFKLDCGVLEEKDSC